MRGEVKLKYCLVAGVIYPVADFAHLPPAERPQAFCPECEQPVTLRLKIGGKRAFHAAHKPDTQYCRLTEPESALHFNTKVYIANQLEKGATLFLEQNCSGWKLPVTGAGGTSIERNCTHRNSAKYLFCENWDDVQMERKIGSLRPDIVLYRKGVPIAAIEVLVTHAVDPAKEEIFAELDVPWAEISADQSIFDQSETGEDYDEESDWDDLSAAFADHDGGVWTIEKALPYRRCQPAPVSWTCPACLEAPDRWLERQAEIDNQERLERLKKLNHERNKEEYIRRYSDQLSNKILYARAFKFLKGLAESEDAEIFVCQRDAPDYPYQAEEIYLKTERYAGQILYSESPVTESSKQKVSDYFKEWLAMKTRQSRQVVDLTGGWITIAEFERLKPHFKNPYKWHPILRQWVVSD